MLLLNGDCIEEMQKLIDDGKQVDSVVTDPPYHLTSIVERFGKEGSAPAQEGTDGAFARASKGFMGKEWDGGDIAFRPETWELALKLLKPGGHLLAFSASRNYHRMAVAIEDAGFEIRDQMMWLYGSGFPKSLNIGKAVDKKQGNDREVLGTKITNVGMQGNNFKRGSESGEVEVTKGDSEWEGWGTALKPAHEPIVMARKPLSEKSIVDNVLKHGTGGINIDASRVQYADENDRSGWHKTGGGGKGYQDTDTFKIREITPEEIQERTKDGRFPANVMHDGSEVVKNIFPKTSGGGEAKYPDTNPDFRDQGKKSKEAIGIDKLSFGQTENVKRKPVNRQPRKDDKVWTNENSGMKSLQYTIEYEDSGNASRYFYCPKVSKSERNQGLDDHETSVGVNGNKWTDQDYRKGDTKPTTERKNTHPTVKPVELMKYLCRLVTPKGGTVLDPFMGSGSTGMAAKDEGFDFIGIEKEKEYFEICESRIKRFAPLMDFM